MKTIMRSLCLAAVMCIMAPAMALACTSPTGVEGEQVYNSTHNVMQYCDGTDWVAMNSIGANSSITTLNSSLTALTTTVGEKVAKNGDTMTGLLALSGAPTANEHAATKEYVDTVAAASSGSNGRYQISCAGNGNNYANQSFCVLLDTQTGATKCQYWGSSYFYSASNWTDCAAQINITNLTGGGIPETGGTSVYAANAYGWGAGNNLGDGDASSNNTPSQVDLNLAFTKIVAGNNATCGLASGKPYCWGGADSQGYGYKGNISGSGGASNSPAALDLSGLGYPIVNDIVYGHSGGMFRTSSGQWYGFGRTESSSNHYNYLVSGGTGLTASRWRNSSNGTTNLPTDFTKFVIATYHACGLRSNGSIYCAGASGSNQGYLATRGDGTDLYCNGTYLPSYNSLHENCPVSGGHTFIDVAISGASGYESSCGVTNTNKIYCWGLYNNQGQLGKGDSTNGTGFPTEVDTSHLSSTPAFEKIYGADNYTTSGGRYCALDTAGKAYCWGNNTNGALGTGDTSTRNRPTPVLGGYTFTDMAMGYTHTCGVTDTGLVYCWGYGVQGQLGYGSTQSKLIPEPVLGAADFVGMAAGQYNTFGWK